MRKLFGIAILCATIFAGCGGVPKPGRITRIMQAEKIWEVCSLEISWPYPDDGRLIFHDLKGNLVVLSAGWRTEETAKPCY